MFYDEVELVIRHVESCNRTQYKDDCYRIQKFIVTTFFIINRQIEINMSTDLDRQGRYTLRDKIDIHRLRHFLFADTAPPRCCQLTVLSL